MRKTNKQCVAAVIAKSPGIRLATVLVSRNVSSAVITL
jgi:hypothetical protein